ncbi:PREDICTED: C-type lectin domain family 4 member A-like isoform X2 [Haliaeetus leucocephalus]|uniref:C-type lectin domain family 4 member A-like isoform X2 n=1 Tax=Haliaeetus leucocephalus TaxID=52644 RepID=UPI00053CAD25|nr:PREDICTED: C-type lectin domain family 4 member A-like isoform X2 [Haliaeetus leucocephalus]
MASEITYAEVKFKNASPAAVVKVPPEKKKRQHHPQKYPLWLPWLISLLLLLVCIALVTALLVAPFSHSGGQPTALQQNFMEWQCISALPQGKEQGWTCCPKDWKRFQKSCYFFSNDTMHGIASEQNCTGMGSHLVVINSEEEQGRGDVLSGSLQRWLPSGTSPSPWGLLPPALLSLHLMDIVLSLTSRLSSLRRFNYLLEERITTSV